MSRQRSNRRAIPQVPDSIPYTRRKSEHTVSPHPSLPIAVELIDAGPTSEGSATAKHATPRAAWLCRGGSWGGAGASPPDRTAEGFRSEQCSQQSVAAALPVRETTHVGPDGEVALSAQRERHGPDLVADDRDAVGDRRSDPSATLSQPLRVLRPGDDPCDCCDGSALPAFERRSSFVSPPDRVPRHGNRALLDAIRRGSRVLCPLISPLS